MTLKRTIKAINFIKLDDPSQKLCIYEGRTKEKDHGIEREFDLPAGQTLIGVFGNAKQLRAIAEFGFLVRVPVHY